MTTSGSYNASTFHKDLDSEIQRLHNQVRLSWTKEARTLAWFGLQDGMSVIELGSGPGFYTEQLLALLPKSSITAVELDPVLIERAEQYLREKTSNRLQMIAASIMDTGLPDNSFDFAVARLVFCHLPDPVGAAREVQRILKPSGKLVIVDLDYDLIGIVAPPIAEFPTIKEKYKQGIAARGGNTLIGRRLWRILQAAGFQNLDLEAVVSHSDALGMEAFRPQIDPMQLNALVKLGLLTEQERESFAASREQFLDSPDSFMLILWLMACGEKPQLVS